MFAKVMFACLAMLVACTNAGLVAPAAYVAPYASSYNAHVVNHAVAAPYVAAAPFAYSSPYVAAPLSAYAYPSAYTAAYSAPYIVAK